MDVLRVIGVFCVLLACSVGPVAGLQEDTSVAGRPDFTAFIPENTLAPGTDGAVSLYLVNNGVVQITGDDEFEQLVQTARQTTVSVSAPENSPITVKTATTPAGTVPEGVAGPYPIRLAVAEDAAPGTYDLTVAVEYEYTSKVITREDGSLRFTERTRTQELPVTVVVEDQPRFTVLSVDSDVAVGETGSVTLNIRNDGTETARDATLLIQSADSELTFGTGAQSAESFVGTWQPGTTKRVTARVGVATDALVRDYAAEAVVEYKNEDGLTQRSNPLSIGIRPQSGQQFAIDNVSSTLSVGDRGTVTGTVTNTGQTTATDVVVVLQPVSPPLIAQSLAVPVGSLEAGESAQFEYPITVTQNATAGVRRLSTTVEYQSPTGRQTTDPFSLAVAVAQKQDRFSVDPVNATFEVDSEGVLVVRLTNDGAEAIRNVNVRLLAEEPVSSADASTFVSRLDAGESTTVSFDLEVSDDAIPKMKAVTLAIDYEQADGTRRTETQQVPVEVIEGAPQQIPTEAIGLAVVVVVAAAVWWYRRR
ncbi:COG1361 S-layer family protein [Haladaptatus sp. DJG-WS-42]|uniref:COG1361 S-layer family protein n=1 Tax=Haladaptatus sp. DJG-WS-42 TaxID=3120516 RepID=UPI0030CC2F04